jgi:hypothetical protein
MRNANAQRENIMSRLGALHQPQKPHVSHAETGGAGGATRRKTRRTTFSEPQGEKDTRKEN